MARINIEDSLYIDIRFQDLIRFCNNDIEKALGAFARLLIIGQQYWKKDRSLIPKHIWVSQRLNNGLIEVGLVEEKDHGFYVKGAEEAFAWIFSRTQNGQKGGKNKSTNDTNVDQNDTNVDQSDTNVDQSDTSQLDAQEISVLSDFNTLGDSIDKHRQAQRSIAKPHTHSHTHTQDNNTFVQSSLITTNKKLFNLETLYEKYPKKIGKKKGLERLTRKIKTQTDFDNCSLAIDRYAEYCKQNNTEKQFIKQFDTFATSYEDYLDEDFGKTTTFDKKPQNSGFDPNF